MLDIFRRSLKTGLVTTDYPGKPEPVPEAYRGQVTLDTNRCTGDAACARICPSGAITVSRTEDGGWVWELDDALCVFCGLCQEACPSQAIRLTNEFELATREASDLITRVTFKTDSES